MESSLEFRRGAKRLAGQAGQARQLSGMSSAAADIINTVSTSSRFTFPARCRWLPGCAKKVTRMLRPPLRRRDAISARAARARDLYTQGYSMRGEWRRRIEDRARELMRDGMLWIDAHRQADSEHRCGARSRSRGGAPCVARPMEGKRRCRHHGGLSTGAGTAEGRARLGKKATAQNLAAWAEGGRWHHKRRQSTTETTGT